jgi:nucleotide-binding universal stress UspA family protein
MTPATLRAGADLMALPDEQQGEDTGTVVVGVDGSDQSADALALAMTLAGLLVLGSRGYGPVGAVLLGSVSNALVRTASCPVVLVPAGSAA